MLGIRRAEPEVERRRRWRILPPPRAFTGRFEGLAILEEAGGEIGALLFQRVRDVMLWAGTVPEERDGLFAATRESSRVPEAGLAIREELQVLEEMVRQPAAADPVRVATACAGIYTWALDQVYYASAAEFAAAGALAAPREPMFAVYAGRAARSGAAYENGVQWFQRAISVARRRGKMAAYVVALLGWSRLEVERADLSKARTLLIRAWKYSRRNKLRQLAAECRHDLLALAIATRQWDDAAAHAQVALELYGPRSKNIFALAHDWALVWVEEGFYSIALPLLETVLPYLRGPSARLLALSSIARAAAAAGDRETHALAVQASVRLTGNHPESTPVALVYLAEAARLIGDGDRAHEFALRGRDAARARDDRVVSQLAETLLMDLKRGVPPRQERHPDLSSPVLTQVTMLWDKVRAAMAGAG